MDWVCSMRVAWVLVVFGCVQACAQEPGSGDGLAPDSGQGDVALSDAAPSDAAPDLWVAPDPLEAPVDAPGPYGVGFREGSITYLAAPGESPRTLRTAIWYPTLDTEGTTTLYYPGTLKREEIWTDAAPAPHEGWPVLVFSHGFAGFAENSYFLTEHFASHGWLVMAMDHTGNTVEDLGVPVETSMYSLRPQDVSAALDHLESLPATDTLAGKGDTSAVALSGHSFGGYTTLASAGASFHVETLKASCEAGTGHSAFCSALDEAQASLFSEGLADPRVALGLPMAPGAASLLDPSTIEVPILQFTGGLDGQTSNDGAGDPIWQALQGPHHRRVNIATAGHQSFTVVCTWFPIIGQGDGCGEGFIHSLEVHKIVNTYALAFARRHLQGDESQGDLLEGKIEVHPEVTLVLGE